MITVTIGSLKPGSYGPKLLREAVVVALIQPMARHLFQCTIHKRLGCDQSQPKTLGPGPC